jgi:hypothetical protein
MHILNCGHVYTDFLPGGRIFRELGAPNTALWYVYKPTFIGEAPYYIDKNNNIVVSLRAYQKAREETESDWFDDKENMEYSPFSLYVLQSDVLNINGVQQSIFAHLPTSDSLEEKTHVSNHLFEKYYIDRYLKAQSAEEMLTERTLLEKRLLFTGNLEEAELVKASTPLYVIDPWYGRIYQVGEYFLYDSDSDINIQNITE